MDQFDDSQPDGAGPRAQFVRDLLLLDAGQSWPLGINVDLDTDEIESARSLSLWSTSWARSFCPLLYVSQLSCSSLT